MKRLFALAVCCVITLVGMTGCSGNLSRWKAKRLILAGLEPHPIGPNKIKAPYVPGFEPADLTDLSSDPSYFVLDAHKPYGEPIGLEKYHFDKQHTPNDEEFIVEALTDAGYLTIREDGPITVPVNGSSLAYSHSRTINFTQKIGKVTQQDSNGESCFTLISVPAIQPQCHKYLPPMANILAPYCTR